MEASQVLFHAVVYDLLQCAASAGISIGGAWSADTEYLRPIALALDSNETVMRRSALKKAYSIFSHLREDGKRPEVRPGEEPISVAEFQAWVQNWTKNCGSLPLDAMMNQASAAFGALALPFENGDIPLYEHSRMLAAVACCDNFDAMPDQKAYLLYSIDLSGIQTFLYSIGSKGALKGLKTRSFYLGVLMAHTADVILERCGFSRLNLIYCGGGKAHLLLKNNPYVVEQADALIEQANRFLQKHYGTALYLARGYAEASLNDLSSWKGETSCFSDLFRQASAMISYKKLCRYSAEELFAFNSREEDHERECAICGNGSHLHERADGCICGDCLRFERFASVLNRSSLCLAVAESPVEPYLSLPFGENMGLCPAEKAPTPIRVYHVNTEQASVGQPMYIGNYQPPSNEPLTFEMLGNASKGICRLGVLRMDVDNLGSLFADGFVQHGSKTPYRRVSLVRYAVLSSVMTRFFQHDINRIVATNAVVSAVGNLPQRGRDVSIVYAGGDDLFLVGAWDQVLDAALAVAEAFESFSMGKASISGGIGVFGMTTPIRQMATCCAELEDAAKEVPGKAAVSVFDRAFTFSWKDYTSQVLCLMLPCINNLCRKEGKGNSFLYHVLELLRDVSQNQIAIARLAYLLARHRPPGNGGMDYDAASRRLYEWALDPSKRRLLEAAIQLYVYLHREGKQA